MWKNPHGCETPKRLFVDLADLTGIDGAGGYLLRLMKANAAASSSAALASGPCRMMPRVPHHPAIIWRRRPESIVGRRREHRSI
jgi:hypothetical protein